MTGVRHPHPAHGSGWHVLTGGPSSGKTTTVNLLHARGYATTMEYARHYIDLQRISGRSIRQIRDRQAQFQRAVVAMQIQQERDLDPAQTVFLDRALPDSLAYYRFLGIDPDPALRDAVTQARYATVFLLDLLPLAPDYARTEDAAAQQRLHELIGQVYRELPFPVVTVPALPPDERVQFILDRTR